MGGRGAVTTQSKLKNKYNMLQGKLNKTTIGQFSARNRRLRRMGFNSYQDFLKSDVWKKLKEYIFNKKEFKECHICGSIRYLVPHHRRYTNLHNIHSLRKMSRDLICLCGDCHTKVHEFNLSSNGDGLNSSIRKLKRLTKVQQ